MTLLEEEHIEDSDNDNVEDEEDDEDKHIEDSNDEKKGPTTSKTDLFIKNGFDAYVDYEIRNYMSKHKDNEIDSNLLRIFSNFAEAETKQGILQIKEIVILSAKLPKYYLNPDDYFSNYNIYLEQKVSYRFYEFKKLEVYKDELDQFHSQWQKKLYDVRKLTTKKKNTIQYLKQGSDTLKSSYNEMVKNLKDIKNAKKRVQGKMLEINKEIEEYENSLQEATEEANKPKKSLVLIFSCCVSRTSGSDNEDATELNYEIEKKKDFVENSQEQLELLRYKEKEYQNQLEGYKKNLHNNKNCILESEKQLQELIPQKESLTQGMRNLKEEFSLVKKEIRILQIQQVSNKNPISLTNEKYQEQEIPLKQNKNVEFTELSWKTKFKLYEGAHAASFAMDHFDDLVWLIDFPVNCYHGNCHSEEHGIKAWFNQLPEEDRISMLKFEMSIRYVIGVTMTPVINNLYFIPNEILKSSMINEGKAALALTVSEYTPWDSIQVNNALNIGTNVVVPNLLAYKFKILSPAISFISATYSTIYLTLATKEMNMVFHTVVDVSYIYFHPNPIVKIFAGLDMLHEGVNLYYELFGSSQYFETYKVFENVE